MSRNMTKQTKRHVRPAKTQISLGIHPVWSESSLSAWRNLGCWATQWVHNEDSDQTGWDTQADLSLCWTHMSVCWFYHVASQMFFVQTNLYEWCGAWTHYPWYEVRLQTWHATNCTNHANRPIIYELHHEKTCLRGLRPVTIKLVCSAIETS